MLYAYYDESGTHGAKEVVIGGLLGSLNQWRSVEDAWRANLAELGIRKFHATECAAGTGEYACCERWKRDYQFQSLARIISTSKLYIMGTTIILDDWDTVMGPYKERFPHQFDFLVEMHIALIAKYSQDFWDGEPVRMVFSPQSQFKERVTKIWQRYKANDEGQVIDSLIFADKSSDPALQAADYLSYELMKYHRSGGTETMWTESPLFSGIRARGAGFVVCYHTAETIRVILDRGPIGLL